jgi:hypothetical protein
MTASYASSSISASFLNGPHTGSQFGTSSWAVSASWASQSISASYSLVTVTTTSASWASQSLSSSYVGGTTASMMNGNLYLYNITTGLRYVLQISGSVGDESLLYAQG